MKLPRQRGLSSAFLLILALSAPAPQAAVLWVDEAELERIQQERREAHKEFARMRELARTLDLGGESAPAKEKRLAVLEGLLRNKMISEADYQARRSEVLSGP